MSLARSRLRGSRADEENPYWISFSDLMSALLVVFILAVVVLMTQLIQKQSDLASKQAELDSARTEFANQIGTLQEAEDVRAEMLSEIRDELVSEGIEVSVSENGSVLSIPSALLGFDSAAYDIKPEYRSVALTIGTVIAQNIEENDRMKYLDTVFVEGHTDDQPFDGLEGTGNWGLSTFRAISLWNLWGTDLPKNVNLSTLTSADGKPLFSVSGYGDTRPAEHDQATEADRSKNRRIDIRFTIVHPTADDLLKIEKDVDGKAGS